MSFWKVKGGMKSASQKQRLSVVEAKKEKEKKTNKIKINEKEIIFPESLDNPSCIKAFTDYQQHLSDIGKPMGSVQQVALLEGYSTYDI